MDLGSISSILGILDPTFSYNVAKYGGPSENMSIDYPFFSPLQMWEMWLAKPEPVVAILDTSLSSLIQNRQPEPIRERNSLMDIIRKLRL